MAKQPKLVEKSVADLQPDELNALKVVLKEFMDRAQNIDNEIETLKDDRKALCEEFSRKLDVKTLQMALKVIKIQSSVQHRSAFDMFIETLTSPAE
jgi:uncharacterized protein (UPF0335 family)